MDDIGAVWATSHDHDCCDNGGSVRYNYVCRDGDGKDDHSGSGHDGSGSGSSIDGDNVVYVNKDRWNMCIDMEPTKKGRHSITTQNQFD